MCTKLCGFEVEGNPKKTEEKRALGRPSGLQMEGRRGLSIRGHVQGVHWPNRPATQPPALTRRGYWTVASNYYLTGPSPEL